MKEDDSLDDVLSNTGDFILHMILDKINKIKLKAYEPKHLIISKHYAFILNKSSSLRYSHNSVINEGITILGLKIHFTNLPDIIEVY